MPTIMVQMMDRQKTLEALHFAGAMAHNRRGKVVLVKMVPVQHIGWLGTELGYASFTDDDQKTLRSIGLPPKVMGSRLRLNSYQYMSLADAVADAADYVNAQIIFAALSHGLMPFQYRFDVWRLRRRLAQQIASFTCLNIAVSQSTMSHDGLWRPDCDSAPTTGGLCQFVKSINTPLQNPVFYDW